MSYLQSALIWVLDFFYSLTGSYGISLILLSAFVSAVLAPFYYLTGILEGKERAIKQRLDFFIDKINTIKNDKIKHLQLKELYTAFSYYPFYSLRSLASLFIQIPMLFAAYEVLTKKPLNGEAFLFVRDLGKPDFLLFDTNLLPIIMTVINVASVFISSQAGSKERRQGIFIAMVFFVLLYNSNAALLIYWTFNQLFSFIRYVLVFKAKNLTMPKISLRGLFLPKPKLINIAFVLAAAAFPATLIYKLNTIYFVGHDLQVYVAILLAMSLAFALLFKYWIGAALILSLMFFPMLRDMANVMPSYWTARFVCTFVFFYFVYFFSAQKYALMIFFACTTIYCAVFIERTISQPNEFTATEIPQELLELKLKDSSSIYLFMHDSYPHKDYAQHFALPDYDELMEVFKENEFNIYDVYSLGVSTLPTMYSTFNMTTDLLLRTKNGITTIPDLLDSVPSFDAQHRHFINGNNISNLLLQKNGYETGVSNIANRYLFSKDNFAYNFYVNDKIGSNVIIHGILARGRLNTTLTNSDVDLNLEFAKYVSENDNKNKIFAWTTAGPDHSSGSLPSKDAELKRWLAKYKKANQDIKTEIEAAVKNNPNAIIIFMSDHGAFIEDIKRYPKNYRFNKTNYIKFRDLFGAFMAVRWPDKEKATKYDGEFNVVQDLFPIVFAYLFDSDVPLKYKVQNTEVQFGPHKFDKGVFYKDFYESWK